MKNLKEKFSNLSQRKKIALLCLLILLINILLYFATATFDFYLDDHRLIANNTRIINFKNFIDSWDELYFRFPDFPFLQYWRPLSMFTFFVDYQIWGLNPLGYHLFNILINALGSMFIFLIFYQISNQKSFAFMVALAYSFHPSKVSAVSWISGRSDLLAALFVFMAVYYFLLFINKNKILPYLICILCFIMGLLSKEIVFLFPIFAAGIIIYFAFLKGKKLKTNGWILKKSVFLLPLILIDGAYLVIHRSITKIGQGFFDIALKEIFIALKAFGAYIKLILIPFNKSPYYYMQEFDNNTLPYLLITVFSTIIFLSIIIKFRDKFPNTIFAFLFFLFLAPLLNLYIMPPYPKILPRFAMISSVFLGVFYLELKNIFTNKILEKIYIYILMFFFALMFIKVIHVQQ